MAIDPVADAEAFGKEYEAEQAAKKPQETPAAPASPLEAMSNWVTNLPSKIGPSVLDAALQWGSMATGVPERAERDVGAGVAGAVKNAGDAVAHVPQMVLDTVAPNSGVKIQFPVWDHASAAIQDFTDAIKVKDPGLTDTLLQYTAQVAPAYALFSRMFGSMGARGANLAAGAAADATTLDPNTPRFADMLRTAQGMDGKIGQALQAAGPYGLNLFINYLAHNGPETEAQARLKNGLDGLMPNGLGNELLHAAMITSKQGMRMIRTGIDNGLGSVGDIPPAAAEPVPKGDASEISAHMDNLFGTAVSPLESDRALTTVRQLARQPDGTAAITGSAHDLVTSLAKHLDDSTEEGAFYKDIFGKLSSKQLDTKLVVPGTGNHAPQNPAYLGEHSPRGATTALHNSAFENNALFAHTVAHEQVHAATLRALSQQPEVRVALSELAAQASEYAPVLNKQDRYGLGSPKEFVAEAESNPRFQKMLKDMKGSDGVPLWDSYKKIVGGIFGITGATLAHPLFDQMMSKEKPGA